MAVIVNSSDEMVSPPESAQTSTSLVVATDPTTYSYRDRVSNVETAEGGGPNLSIFVHAIRRKWLLGFVLGVLVCIPAVMATYTFYPLSYKARRLVRISQTHKHLLFPTADQTGGPDYKSFKNTQRQLLLSAYLLNLALSKPEVVNLQVVRDQPDPVTWLQDELEITFPDNAEIMQVAFDSPNPDTAKRIVDAVMETYKDEVISAETEERHSRISELEKAQADAETNARTKRTDLRNLAQLTGSSDSSALNLAQQAAVQHLSLLQTELMKVQFDLLRAETEAQVGLEPTPAKETATGSPTAISQTTQSNTAANQVTDPKPVTVPAAQSNVADKKPTDEKQPDGKAADGKLAGEKGAPPAAATVEMTPEEEDKVMQLIEADRVGLQLVREIDRLDSYVKQVEKKMPAVASKMVKKYIDQIDVAKKELEERKQYFLGVLRQQVTPEGTPVFKPDRAKELAREIAILKAQQKRLSDELETRKIENKKLGTSSVDVEMKVREVELSDKVVAGVADELERTRIELKSGTRITMRGPTSIPQAGESKYRIPATIAAGVAGLFLPLLLLMGLDLRRQFVNGGCSVLDQTSIPLLGSLPYVPRNIMKRIGNEKDRRASVWRLRLAESISTVTSLLLRKLDIEGHRVVLITSATPGEGKSTLAGHLAICVANSGHRTLLIDFDLRRPIVHRMHGLSLEPGATDILRKGAKLEETVRETSCANLNILTAGACPGSLLQDAANGTLKALLEEARKNYEIVIVDSSPLLPIMDGRLIGQYTDTAIMSVIKDVSQIPNLTDAREIMADYGIPVLGCVVTGDSGDCYYAGYLGASPQ